MARNSDRESTKTTEQDAPDRDRDAEAAVSDATSQVDEVVEDVNAKGYWGAKADPTPNEHYTVEGVLAGKPTPETDADLAREAGSRKQFDI